MTFDLVVVGGGIVGLSAAYFAARRGLRTALFEARELGRGASWAGAGVLTPIHPEGYPEPLVALTLDGARFWPDFAREIEEASGTTVGYLESGAVEVFFGDGARERAEAKAAWWRERGLAAEPAGPEVRERIPLAETVRAACLLPSVAQVRNPRALQAIARAAARAGAALHPHRPVAVVEDGAVVVGAGGGEERIAARAVLVAAGAWTRELLPAVRTKPVRGQIVLLHHRRLPLRPIVLFGEYIVPRGDGLYLVGATVEEVGYDEGTTEEALAHLVARAVEVVPRLSEATRVRAWAGLRPGTDDGLPYLGRLPGTRIFVAAGHFRHGLILGPLTAKRIVEAIAEDRDDPSLAPFRPDR